MDGLPHYKRLFDLTIGITLSLLLLPLFVVIALLILLLNGRPVVYISERMKTPRTGFQLVKFRTMSTSTPGGASGGYKSSEITAIGRILRRARLDELPQLWNVLVGDMSIVGPRPPRRIYVEQFPELYEQVLRNRPGITGLASVYFHEHEERLLSRTMNEFENNEVYCRMCVPRKARLDRIYAANFSICFDVLIMLKTVFKSLR